MSSNPVLKTLIYESIFNFPLYRNELWKFLISEKKIGVKSFSKFLKDKRIKYDRKTKLYYLNKASIRRRLQAKDAGIKKLRLARGISSVLSKIPTIRLMGVSGSLALGSCHPNDDIDFFIVCKKNTVWTTRLFSVIFLKLKGLYREDNNFKDKICLNMIIDNYHFAESRRDLYTAFEIAKLLPVFSKDQAYDKMISSNSWIKKYMPNVSAGIYINTSSFESASKLISYLFLAMERTGFEKIAKIIQLLYMKKRTNEEISDHFLAFHPRDFRNEILTKFVMLNKDY